MQSKGRNKEHSAERNFSMTLLSARKSNILQVTIAVGLRLCPDAFRNLPLGFDADST